MKKLKIRKIKKLLAKILSLVIFWVLLMQFQVQNQKWMIRINLDHQMRKGFLLTSNIAVHKQYLPKKKMIFRKLNKNKRKINLVQLILINQIARVNLPRLTLLLMNILKVKRALLTYIFSLKPDLFVFNRVFLLQKILILIWVKI
jgi:hypothetical protein